MTQHLAGIEMGGTKTIVVLGRPGAIIHREQFPTTTPAETLTRAIAIIRGWQRDQAIAALGVASFGPIRVAPAAADYGVMLDTPKPGWTGAAVLEPLRAALDLPMLLDTDVNGAALAEHRLGAGQGCDSMVYLTVGTGLGGGVLQGGKPVHGALHPELGHVYLRRLAGDDFGGACPFHGDCAEGLLNGPALAARFGRHPADVPANDAAWNAVAHDLAQLLAMLVLTLSPQRIIVGGGVSMRQPHLLGKAVAAMPAILGGYLADCTPEALQALVVPPLLGDDAGPNGALILAEMAAG